MNRHDFIRLIAYLELLITGVFFLLDDFYWHKLLWTGWDPGLGHWLYGLVFTVTGVYGLLEETLKE